MQKNNNTIGTKLQTKRQVMVKADILLYFEFSIAKKFVLYFEFSKEKWIKFQVLC